MAKVVVYTCITGTYDTLMQPEVTAPDFDFVCFVEKGRKVADREGVWEIRELPCGFGDSVTDSRYPKILPHEVFPEYDFSVWIDGNIRIVGKEFYDAVISKVEGGSLFCGVSHLKRDCCYIETKTCRKIGYISLLTQFRIWALMMAGGFPMHYGMYENGILFRAHNDDTVVRTDRHWWKLFRKYGKRDQMTLMFCLYKSGIGKDLLLPEGRNARNSDCLEYHPHNSPKRNLR